MAASQTDFFTEVGNPGTATTLAAPGHSVSGTSITVVSTTNWPTTTGAIFAIDTFTTVTINGVATEVRDVGSYTEWEGIVASSTSITNMVLRYGTDQTYPAGANTRVYIPVASSRENRLSQGIQVHADQDGTLKAGSVDNAAVLASDVVTTVKILDANVTTTKLANASVTASKLSTGANQAFVGTSENTTSTSYVDLTTTTDTITVTIGSNGLALVAIYSYMQIGLANAQAFVSFAVSGATTIAAQDSYALEYEGYVNNGFARYGATFVLTGLAAGSTTFKMKYKVSSNTGTFADRRLSVVPL